MLATRPVGVASRQSVASAARPVCASRATLSSGAALATWSSSRHDGTLGSTHQVVARRSGAAGGPGRKEVTMMGNKASGGIFSPLVVVTRSVIGEKDFNKLRGKAISLHSQVIKDFCKIFGVDNKQVQGVIRLAKKNGEWLGFLA